MGSTFDKEITLDCLQKIKAMLDLITERSSVVETPNGKSYDKETSNTTL